MKPWERDWSGAGQQPAAPKPWERQWRPWDAAPPTEPMVAGEPVPADQKRRDFSANMSALGRHAGAAASAAGTFVDDAARSVARGVPVLGAIADRLDPQPERDADFAQRNPTLSTALEIGGGLASMVGAAATAPGAAALGIRGPWWARIPAGAASGAALAGGDAAIRGGDAERAALWGAGLGAAAPVVGQAVGRVVSGIAGRVAQRALPTTDEIGQAATQAYRAAGQAGVVIAPQSFTNFATQLMDEVRSAGFSRALHPGIAAAMREVANAARSGPLTLEQVDILRRVIQSGGRDLRNPDQGRLAGLMVDRLDDYLGRLGQGDILAGDAGHGVQALNEARALWARKRKSEVIGELYERAANQAGANYTTAGMETALRQQFKALAGNQRQFARFSPEEQQAILGVVRGGPVQNAWRFLGKFAPRGLVSTVLSGAAGSAAGIGPMGAFAMGEAGRAMSSAATRRQAALVDALVRSGGNLPQTTAGPAADRATTALVQALAIPSLPRWATAPVPQVAVQR